MTNNNFNLTRMYHFIRRQLVLNVSSMWIAFGAVFGTLLFISFITAWFNPIAVGGLSALYTVVLFFSGYIFSSRIFNEMNRPQKAYLYLTLPVSTGEKLSGTWFVSGPVFGAVFSALAFLLFEASKLVAEMRMPDVTFPAFFDLNYFRQMGIFLVTQTFFFLGACSFKGNNFLKTLLALFTVVVVITIFTAVIAQLVLDGAGNQNDYTFDFDGDSETVVSRIWQSFFWFVLGPFLLLVSYFKLKEREI